MINTRYRQADREALITLGVYAFFFLWWTVFAFGLGGGDPGQYSYVLGMPAWFFYSCVLGYPVVSLALWAVIRLYFKDMPLDAAPSGNPAAEGAGRDGDGKGSGEAS
ncbi:MAG: YhdT family protein [Deltaproteobacteria bacterium]|nr:YhdT family protein [Deltaproteobacteria bacterium]